MKLIDFYRVSTVISAYCKHSINIGSYYYHDYFFFFPIVIIFETGLRTLGKSSP